MHCSVIDSLISFFYPENDQGGARLHQRLACQSKLSSQGRGDLSFLLPKAQEPDIEPEDIPLDILYEDSDVLVVNKPKDMVVLPAAGHYSHTLVNAVLYHCRGQLSGINGVLRPGIVHRIDKDTTGPSSSVKMTPPIRACRAVCGPHDHASLPGDCTRRADRRRRHHRRADWQGQCRSQKKAVNQVNGKRAVTHYTVLKRFERFTYIECRLETGRTHQIRVPHGVNRASAFGRQRLWSEKMPVSKARRADAARNDPRLCPPADRRVYRNQCAAAGIFPETARSL